MAKAEAAVKVRKKKWYSIVAPPIFREVVIGEIPLYESTDMKKRGLTVNMMNLTGNPKNQHISVMLRIVDVKEGKGTTELLGYKSNPGSIKRLVRRGRTKVEDSFVVLTSDGKKVRVKPLMVTSTTVAKGVAASMRTKVRNSVARLAAKLTYEKLVEEILSFKLQKHIYSVASKVTPLRNSEIKSFLLVEREGVKTLAPTEEPEAPVEEAEPQEAEQAQTEA